MIETKNISKMVNLILFVAGIYIVITILLYIFQSSLVYFPDRKIIFHPNQAGMDYEEVNFKTCDDIKLHGWFIPSSKDKSTILFCHGNAGNISHRLGSIGIFHQIGLNVFIFDYRGFGKSKGSPSERGTYADARAAWNYLVEGQNISPENIILFGRSLGSGIAAWLAKEKKAKAVILESSFTSIPDLGRKYYPIFPVKLISRIEYPVIEYVQRITCAKLFIHSIDDELIPYKHGQKNFAVANEPKDFLEIHGSHNEGFLISKNMYIRGIKEFLTTLPSEND